MTRYIYWDQIPSRKYLNFTVEDIDDEAVVIVRDGAYDVTAILALMVALTASDGSTDAGFVYCENDNSVTVFDDGTDVLTLAVAANGQATLQRTAGTMTFDITFHAVWI